MYRLYICKVTQGRKYIPVVLSVSYRCYKVLLLQVIDADITAGWVTQLISQVSQIEIVEYAR